jgi:hypothetical protein
VARKFTLHCHEITVRFVERAVVPPYEGSMIRGAFGRSFKESCCPFPHDGRGCPLGETCPYGYVFESSPPVGAREFAKNQEVPRPYVFEPPEQTKMEYGRGEMMRFNFIVVGRAADFIPYFVYAFSKMGREGVGRLRARYELQRIIAKNPLLGTELEIFDGEVVKNHRLPVVWEDAVSAASTLGGERLRLQFLTPTLVKFKGQVSSEAPTFAALVQALLIRIPMLSSVHCGELWQEDFRGLVKRAEEIETVSDETTWASFRRYSSFKRKSEALEGVVGGAEYEGSYQDFLPLLYMGQLTHVGKRAVFGLGRYRLSAA